MSTSIQKTNVLEYEYNYPEVTLECILDHRKGDLKGISLFCSFSVVIIIIIIIIITSYAPISSKIKLSGATKPRG